MNGPPGPFPVDPETMSRIRPMEIQDAGTVARLHAAWIAGGLWARLGADFLAEVYRALIPQPAFIGFVYDDGRIRGLIAGAEDSRALARGALRRWPFLGVAASRGLLRRPGAALALLETPAYFRRSGDPGGRDGVPESLFCAVEPALRGRRTAGHLNKALFDELLARGHRRVKVTTEAANEAARRQLLSWGFAEVARFRFYGKEMVRYELDLQASPRVEPTRRHRPPGAAAR